MDGWALVVAQAAGQPQPLARGLGLLLVVGVGYLLVTSDRLGDGAKLLLLGVGILAFIGWAGSTGFDQTAADVIRDGGDVASSLIQGGTGKISGDSLLALGGIGAACWLLWGKKPTRRHRGRRH
jgi:hypothetical protein